MGDKELQSATRSFISLDLFCNPCGVTLTMKQANAWTTLDPINASVCFRHFRNRINKKLFGNAAKRFHTFTPIVALIEKSLSGRYHYHCVIDRPARISCAAFEHIVSTQWANTPFGYTEIDFQHEIDSGWIAYITKRSQKSNFGDSIDWLNTQISRPMS